MHNENLGRLAAQWDKVAERLELHAAHTGNKLFKCLASDYRILAQSLTYSNICNEMEGQVREWEMAYIKHVPMVYAEKRYKNLRGAITQVRRRIDG